MAVPGTLCVPSPLWAGQPQRNKARGGGILVCMLVCRECGAALREGSRFCQSCGKAVADSRADQDPLIGRVIGDAYVVLELVGVGGMGRVYRAEQRALARSVAIKVIHPHLLSDETSVARFYTEARAASSLNHPNSVGIIDFGRTDDGILYLVMEFLKGKDLSQVICERGLLPLSQIRRILCAVLAALQEAHALGVVHRDLKPENIIVDQLRTGGDLIKVVDFGLAKLRAGDAHGSKATRPGLVYGTPDYMSPEQGRGEPVDARGDLYSMGVLLFELLTGELPFAADTPTNVVIRHVSDPVPDPRDVAPGRQIPAELAAVVAKAMAKDPADRYADAREMAAALRGDDAAHAACPACGARSPAGKRFCPECGKPMASSVAVPVAQPGSDSDACVGRARELGQLHELRQQVKTTPALVHVVGETGVGKSHLLRCFAREAAEAGDLVLWAGPHPSRTPVPYAPIRTLLAQLFDVDLRALQGLARELAHSLPLVSTGIAEVVVPRGIVGAGGRAPSGAVASALAHGVERALQRTERSRAILVVDDLFSCDMLSALALKEIGRQKAQTPVMLVTADVQHKPKHQARATRVVELLGLTRQQCRDWAAGRPVAGHDDGDAPRLLPLYASQVRRLGLSLDEPSHNLPGRLSDAIQLHLERLDAAARKLLQAAAVLGDRFTHQELRALCDPTSGWDSACESGLLVLDGEQIRFSHGFVRELVAASTPAQARKALHGAALELRAGDGSPLEVRAPHIVEAGDHAGAMNLFARMGGLAASRGDPYAAAAHYRRAQESARLALLESGSELFEDSLVSIGRKLGIELARRDDAIGAESVLRDALDRAGPSSPHRPPILLELGRLKAQRGELRDGYRWLGEALELAIKHDLDDVQAQAQLTLGILRRTEGNLPAALSSLTSAFSLLLHAAAPVEETAAAAVELAETLVESAQGDAVRLAAERAHLMSKEADAPLLCARSLLVAGRVESARGEEATARSLFEQARQAALRAGDAPLSRRIARLAN